MYQERSFAAQRCWLVICQSRPNTYTNNTIYISKTASSSDKLCKVTLGPNLPSIQFIYRKLYPLRTMFSSIIYVSNVRRPILCSSALLIGDLYVSPKYYTINTIHISKTSLTSDEYCSSYNSFPSFFHQKWRPSWIFLVFRSYFLPMSLSSSLRSFYRKPHQNRTSSSRVIEEHTDRQTDRQTYFTLLFIVEIRYESACRSNQTI